MIYLLLSPEWMVSQLLSYDPLSWLAFVSIAALTAYWGRYWGVLGGQVLVALLVLMLDINYQSNHSQEMDIDFVFVIGVSSRIILINTALLPVSAMALWQRRRAIPQE